MMTLLSGVSQSDSAWLDVEDADGEELDRCIGEPFGTEKKIHGKKGMFAYYTVISHSVFP